MRAVVCGGSPLPVSAVHREVLPLWAIVFHQWAWWLQMFCGHFHAEPTQILTGEVRVDKPSGPRPSFHVLGAAAGGHTFHLPGASGRQQPGLVTGNGVVPSSRPRSRVSWCSEKLLPPLSFTLQDGSQRKQLEQGKKEAGGGGLDAAILGSSSSHGFLRGGAKLAKKEKATNKTTTNRNTLASIPSRKDRRRPCMAYIF